ncbi:MAG: 5-formyltetrahydrofolate cyclo-ligase, partial [Clostridia bacterium]|nr:5-formyltetrahydrofolate cyclo-ligase [Clostridia bacterium]
MDKKELRKIIKNKAGALKREYVISASRAICERLFALRKFAAAKSLFVYLSAGKEVQTDEIIEEARASGKEIFVPVCVAPGVMRAVSLSGARLELNKYGIREPVSWEREAAPGDLDLIIVPCVSASKDKRRLGHGGGYYDRFLKESLAFSACLCFDKLLSDDIPEEPHDLRP